MSEGIGEGGECTEKKGDSVLIIILFGVKGERQQESERESVQIKRRMVVTGERERECV